MTRQESALKAMQHVEARFLDAIGEVADYDPALVVFAGAGLIARLAIDFAPCKGDARDLLNLAIQHEMDQSGGEA